MFCMNAVKIPIDFSERPYIGIWEVTQAWIWHVCIAAPVRNPTAIRWSSLPKKASG